MAYFIYIESSSGNFTKFCDVTPLDFVLFNIVSYPGELAMLAVEIVL